MLQKLTKNSVLFASAILLALIAIPQVSFALTFRSLASFFIFNLVNPLVYVIIGFGVVYFLWGVAKYILHSGDVKAREEGRSMMIFGIIAIFVMVSIWGFVNLLDQTFKLDNTTIPRAQDFLP